MKAHTCFPFFLLAVLISIAPGQVITVGLGGGYDYSTIQAAIDASNNDDIILIAQGTYTGAGNHDLDFGGKAIMLRSTAPYDPAVVAATVIDCQNLGRGFYFHSGETNSSVISGLTITNGKIVGDPVGLGGALFCSGASPKIVNCVISNNSAHSPDYASFQGSPAYGGGLSARASSAPKMINCKFINNLAIGHDGIQASTHACGGAINCDTTSRIEVYHCQFILNKAQGGKFLTDAGDYFPCSSEGGAISLSYYGQTSTIKNCLFDQNITVVSEVSNWNGYGYQTEYGDSKGGAIFSPQARANILNCTFVNNKTHTDNTRGIGGAVYGPLSLINCIVWQNVSTTQLTNVISANYCDIQEGRSGTGNIWINPSFTSISSENYYLSQVAAGQGSTSPCVDAGSATAASVGLDDFTTRTDFAPDSGTVDMGYHRLKIRIGDIDGDWDVDLADFSFIGSQWQQAPGLISADLVADGIVNMQDLAVFCDTWLWQN